MNCNNGNECVHPDGPENLPVSEFYAKSDGYIIPQCRACKKAYQAKYTMLEYIADNEGRITALNNTPKRGRVGRLHRLIKNGHTTVKDLKAILAAVDF